MPVPSSAPEPVLPLGGDLDAEPDPQTDRPASPGARAPPGAVPKIVAFPAIAGVPWVYRLFS
jgi:hypothetical protein